MIRHSPCELYLKYLLVHPDGFSNEEVLKRTRLQQLDPVSEGYLNRLRSSTVPPRPFYPLDQRHEPSRKFLLRQRIWQLFHPSEEMLAAMELLDNPRGKETIESMVMSRSDPQWIASALNRIGIPASSEAIDLYRKHFWDIDLVDSTELRLILHQRVSLEGLIGNADVLLGYSKEYKNDVRMMTANMPIPTLAAMLNMMRLGFMPSHVEVTRIASAARTGATVRTLEAVMRGGPFDNQRGRDFAEIARIMTDMIESVGSPDEDLQHKMSLLLRTDEAEVPSIHQLSAGHHTADVQPLKKDETEDVK